MGNHCPCSKHVRKKLSIGVDLNIRENLAIGTCLKTLASTRRKVRCRGLSYTLASTPHSTDQRYGSFNPLMLKMCGDVESNPEPINYPCKECGKNVRNNHAKCNVVF